MNAPQKSFGFMEWFSGNCIDLNLKKFSMMIEVNYGFALFLALLFFLIARAIMKKCRKNRSA